MAAVDQAGQADCSSGSINSRHQGSGFGGWLQRVRRTGEFSDLLVRINSAAEFKLHWLPLKNGCAFFRERNDPEIHQEQQQQSEVQINELLGGADAFAIAADFCYLIKPSFTFGNVGGVRSVAAQLGMPELLDSTKKFLYANVFCHWRSCAAFLEGYSRLGDPCVDSYIESRCLKVIASACTKAFSETKHVSVPIIPKRAAAPGSSKCPVEASAAAACSSSSVAIWSSSASPCASLTEILITICSRLPDFYMEQLIETLLEADVNLSLKCRQGRNVRAWLNHLLRDECSSSHRARCWILICLSEMLLRASSPMPRMELSSQYWCSLLEHVEEQISAGQSPIWDEDPAAKSDKMGAQSAQMGARISHQMPISIPLLPRLRQIQSLLEERIGASLHELDDYLHSYRFSASTLLSLVRHFVQNRAGDPNCHDELEEVAVEVDGCLWCFAETPFSITPAQFVAIFSAFPASCRSSHDSLYASIDKMLHWKPLQNHTKNTKNTMQSSSKNSISICTFESEEIESLWSLVDCDKLSPAVHEQALNNPSFLCQPRVLERVLRMHSEELAAMGDEEDRRNLRNIMHKVIKASLKLLEENSRRSREILQLQNQYAALLGQSINSHNHHDRFSSSCENSPDFKKNFAAAIHPDEHDDDEDEAENDDQVPQEHHSKKHHPHEEDEENHPAGLIQAPQTPMVEARRSIQCLTVGEILAS